MKLGPITIRWTKDVEAEAKEQAIDEKVRHRQIFLLLEQTAKLKAVLHRWGLDMGLLDGGGIREAKDPQGGGRRSIVVPSPKCGQFMD